MTLCESLRAAAEAVHAGSPVGAVIACLVAKHDVELPTTPCEHCEAGTVYEAGETIWDPPEAVECKWCEGTGEKPCGVCGWDPERVMAFGDTAGDACCLRCALFDADGNPEPVEVVELAQPIARWARIKREALEYAEGDIL